MTDTYTRFDAADFLRDDEDIALYLAEVAAERDPDALTRALGTVARARNMSQLARDTGMTRAGLSKALGAGGNPSFATVMKVAGALGFQVLIAPRPMPIDAEPEPADTPLPVARAAPVSAMAKPLTRKLKTRDPGSRGTGG